MGRGLHSDSATDASRGPDVASSPPQCYPSWFGVSMTQRTIVRVPEEIANKYRFVVVAGKRCEQLQRGAFPKVEVVVPVNKHGQAQDAPKLASFWGQVAMAEVEENRIAFEEPEIITIEDTTVVPISGE